MDAKRSDLFFPLSISAMRRGALLRSGIAVLPAGNLGRESGTPQAPGWARTDFRRLPPDCLFAAHSGEAHQAPFILRLSTVAFVRVQPVVAGSESAENYLRRIRGPAPSSTNRPKAETRLKAPPPPPPELDGVFVGFGVGAGFTVTVAALLRTLPRRLLTSTV